MNIQRAIALAKQKNISLEEIINNYFPEVFGCVLPQDEIDAYTIYRIAEVYDLYNCVLEFLKQGLPIYDPSDDFPNDEIEYDMKNIHVSGHGSSDIITNIFDIQTQPRMVGRMLANYYDDFDIPRRRHAHIPGVSDIILIMAQIYVIQKSAPYDTTCMQLPEYKVLMKITERTISQCLNSGQDDMMYILHGHGIAFVGDVSVNRVYHTSYEKVTETTAHHKRSMLQPIEIRRGFIEADSDTLLEHKVLAYRSQTDTYVDFSDILETITCNDYIL